jgi:[ribosomal protein S18]-alanine N-acetyltransferase
MQFVFSSMDEHVARVIQHWQYEQAYAAYSMSTTNAEALAEFLDRRSPYYAAYDEQQELVGFCVFGSSALVGEIGELRIFVEEGTITIGLGLCPDMTGKHIGLSFVEAILDFARRMYQPEQFVLYVYDWNQRAITVYQRAGFAAERTVIVGEGKTFLEMRRKS